MIFDLVPKLIRVQFDRPSNVHRKTEPNNLIWLVGWLVRRSVTQLISMDQVCALCSLIFMSILPVHITMWLALTDNSSRYCAAIVCNLPLELINQSMVWLIICSGLWWLDNNAVGRVYRQDSIRVDAVDISQCLPVTPNGGWTHNAIPCRWSLQGGRCHRGGKSLYIDLTLPLFSFLHWSSRTC